MRKPTLVPTDATTNPVYLTAAAISSLIQSLPSGTAYCIGIVLIVMVTGRLMQHKGSLVRAALPLVLHLEWGWHRVERAMERGKFLLAVAASCKANANFTACLAVSKNLVGCELPIGFWEPAHDFFRFVS